MSSTDAFRLLVLTDAHSATSVEETAGAPAEMPCRLGVELVRRAIDDARHRGGFDAVALLGDMLQAGAAPASGATLALLTEEISAAAGKRPVLVAPGNHDGDRLMAALGARPGGCVIGPYRFYVFADRYGAGEVCTRGDADRQAFLDWADSDPAGGPIVVLQHNAVNPPIDDPYPYMLTNRPAVMADYARAGVLLSLSGHFHAGQDPSAVDGVNYFTAPALIQEPFRYTLVTLPGRGVSVEARSLKADPGLALVDSHVHTEFAYCGKGMSAAAAAERARTFGLARVCLVEHAPQLYCTEDDFWNARHIHQPQLWRDGHNPRMADFRQVLQPLRSDYVRVGLEAEIDADGQLTIHPEDRQWVDLVVGAIHWIREDPAALTDAELARAFMWACERVLEAGVDILAHPWRLFGWAKRPVPKGLYGALADMLAATGTAAEINWHLNSNDPEFFAQCIARGVKIAFGSDAHRLSEVGNLGPHLQLLREAAGASDPATLRRFLL